MRAASKLVKRQALRRRISSRKVGGFTIIETMIVLAVTGALLLVAILAVGGRQNETEFQQAINDVSSSFQQVINQTSSGNFQEAQKISCVNSGGKPDISDASSSPTDTEGTSTDCIFVGKVVQFYNGTGNLNKQFIAYPVAGLRKDPATGNQCTTIACVAPILVGPDSGAGTAIPNSFPDDGVPTTLLYGLSIGSISFVQPSGSTGIGGFAVMSSLGGTNGSQQFYLVPMRGTSFGYNSYNTATSRPNDISWFNKNLQWSYNTALNLINTNSNYSVQICFVSGTTNQSGLVKIGGNGGDLNSITTTIYSNKTCS